MIAALKSGLVMIMLTALTKCGDVTSPATIVMVGTAQKMTQGVLVKTPIVEMDIVI